MTRCVLVTRPEPGASATAEALRKAGFDPVIASLTDILPLPVDDRIDIGKVDAVAVTSANAIRHAPQQLLARLAELPLFAVGDATAEAARCAGFREVVTGQGDAARLAPLVLERLRAGSTVLYLCGRLRRPDFEQALQFGNVKTVALETYDTHRRTSESGLAKDFQAASPLFAVLVHSSEASSALRPLILEPAVTRLFAETFLVAISARAAAPLGKVFAGRILVALEPTDAAMISALEAAG